MAETTPVCDRCGAKSEPGEQLNFFGWRMAHHSLNMAVIPATLCPKCAASFDSWWLQPQRRWGRKPGVVIPPMGGFKGTKYWVTPSPESLEVIAEGEL